jgi:hypothetical protein
MKNNNNNSGGKICSVCGKWFPSDEYHYGQRGNNTYCRACRIGYSAAYNAGGKEATQKYLKDKRASLEEL